MGMYSEDYRDDNPIHFSDPSYLVIKPNYRANYPLPNFDNVQMKGRYSFNAFGRPFLERENQDAS